MNEAIHVCNKGQCCHHQIGTQEATYRHNGLNLSCEERSNRLHFRRVYSTVIHVGPLWPDKEGSGDCDYYCNTVTIVSTAKSPEGDDHIHHQGSQGAWWE
jgi:hypothetical protein